MRTKPKKLMMADDDHDGGDDNRGDQDGAWNRDQSERALPGSTVADNGNNRNAPHPIVKFLAEMQAD